MNDDGKADIVFVGDGFNYGELRIFQNTSTFETISFKTLAPDLAPTEPLGCAVGDLDGDSKPDVISSGIWPPTGVRISRNISTVDSVKMTGMPNLGAGGTPWGIAIGDLNDDSKPDAVVGTSSGISVLRNTSSVGAISFAGTQVTPTTGTVNRVDIEDLNGDGKPEVAAASSRALIFRNTSSGGAISFAPYTSHGTSAVDLAIGDLDGDGKPDLAAANDFNFFSILRNAIGEGKLCPGGSTTMITNTAGTVYQWQVNTGAGFVDIVNSVNYEGSTTNVLTLSNIPSSWSAYEYRCVVDGVNGPVEKLKFINTWDSGPGSWEAASRWSCGSVPDQYTDVVIVSGQVTINSNVTINTLTLNPGVTLTVKPGFTLTVLH